MVSLKYAPFKGEEVGDNSIRAVRNTGVAQCAFSLISVASYVLLLLVTPFEAIPVGLQRAVMMIALPVTAGIFGYIAHKRSSFLVPHLVFSTLTVIVMFQDLAVNVFRGSKDIIDTNSDYIPWIWLLLSGGALTQVIIHIAGASVSAHVLRKASE